MSSNMEAELLESEVVFSESDSDSDRSPESPNNHYDFCQSFRNSYSKSHQTASNRKAKGSSTIPLDIPDTVSQKNDEYEYEGNDGEMIPPHLIVARRNSVRTGSNLRGRNLRQVRNSILRMTGFLES